MTEQERKHIAVNAAKAMNREGEGPSNQNRKILAEEALIAFASESAATHYLNLIAEGKSSEQATALLAKLENSMPAEIKSAMRRLDNSARLAFVALYEIQQIRKEAEAMGYWRMPEQ